MSTATERQRDADRKKSSRQQSRRVHVSVTTNSLRRRKRYEHDIQKWLRFYFPDVFEYDFTAHQASIVNAILTAAQEGGDQAIAAPRGDGKTSIAECVILYCVLTGVLTFPVIFSATGEDAERILANIKQRMEENERLIEDYGEVCQPAAALEGLANRANGQVVWGNLGATNFGDQRTKIKWSGRQVVLPTVAVKGSRASGQIIATRGLDAAVRGIRYGTMRPDLAVIDDPETRDIACSDDDRQRHKLERKIDQDIAGCAGQKRRLSRVMLTTLMSRRAISYKYTNPAEKHSFRGKRFRYMVTPPKRQDMWEEFVSLQQQDWAADPRTHKAHEFYVSNRTAMDAGAVVGNPHRRGDGIEASAIESYYVEVARVGQVSVATEYDNDPPEDTGVTESGISPYRIQRQVSGTDRRVIPDGCTILTQGIDVRKIALHWVVRAWRPETTGAWTGFTIDYGVTETNVQPGATESAVDAAIIRALHDRREFVEEDPYAGADGVTAVPEYSLVDSGWRTEAIYQFCDEAGLGWYPAQGHGKSSGCAAIRFTAPTQSTPTKLIGWAYYLAARPGSGGSAWLAHMDADHWKAWEHDRWMSDPEKPGGLLMWGIGSGNPDRMSLDERAHHSFARHICAEIEVEEPDKNGVMKRYWKAKSDNNHWLDAAYRCDVAAAMAGVRLFGMPLLSQEDDGDKYTGPIVDFGG